MQMDRGEVEVEEARQTRVRASILTTDKNEYEVTRAVLRSWSDSCVKGRAKHP